MGSAIGLRDDFDGMALRRLARASKSANQARRCCQSNGARYHWRRLLRCARSGMIPGNRCLLRKFEAKAQDKCVSNRLYLIALTTPLTGISAVSGLVHAPALALALIGPGLADALAVVGTSDPLAGVRGFGASAIQITLLDDRLVSAPAGR